MPSITSHTSHSGEFKDEFKVGDEVKIIDNGVGGTIVSIDENDNDMYVVRSEYGFNYPKHATELNKITISAAASNPGGYNPNTWNSWFHHCY